ncbi:MAG: YigZ family protein [Actinomycetaceae bacterium]|nr:YigZ family protein [Actinomycetaceae bacterium]
MRSVKTGTWVRNEIEIQRSRFITTLAHTPTEEEARAFIASIREEFPDARHNCSAFVVKPEGLNEIGHSSDDGEPSGTAGPPMLEVLLREGVVGVTAVVTRYFGGILLGAGGLIRAYSTSVSTALQMAQIVEIRPVLRFELDIPHAFAGRIEADLRARGYEITDVQYREVATLTVALAEEMRADFHSLIAEITAGEVTPREISPTTIEVEA